MTNASSNSDQYPHSTSELAAVIGLEGPMASFEGTAIAPFIKNALVESGIDPHGYDPRKYGHDNYLGFVATSPNYGMEPNPSPIVLAMVRALDSGEIVQERTVYGSGRSKLSFPVSTPENRDTMGNAFITSNLTTIGMVIIRDGKTGEVMAYAAELGTDAGRSGHAILSTNDVIDSADSN